MQVQPPSQTFSLEFGLNHYLLSCISEFSDKTVSIVRVI